MDEHDEIPDVRIGYVTDDGKIIPGNDIEVVSFTPYSENEGLDKFLKRTKFSGVYAYPPGTVLLCWVERPLKSATKTASQMAIILERNLSPDTVWKEIYLCNPTSNGDYYLASLYPTFQEYS